MNIVMPRPKALFGVVVFAFVASLSVFSVIDITKRSVSSSVFEVIHSCVKSQVEEVSSLPTNASLPTIFLITATYPRPARLADMTRLANTLKNVPNLLWIVIEDQNDTIDAVRRLLDRSGIAYAYFAAATPLDLPKIGNHQKNKGFEFIRTLPSASGVVYIADDDNSYDLRIFEDYMRNVQTVGVWAVGLAGMAYVEAPKVNKKGEVVGFNVIFDPKRKFAVDMAGFAFNVRYIIENRNASFHKDCPRFSPETCFLEQINITHKDLQPFGYNDYPQEILVWHTRTATRKYHGSDHGYYMEH